MLYYTSKKVAARFVSDLLMFSEIDLQSIMITKREQSAAYCVSIVTDLSSEGIVLEMVARSFYSAHISTSPPNTPVG